MEKQFPSRSSYNGVYDAHKMLTPRTILAHGVYLTKEERQLVKNRGAPISHCPISNSALSSGICPVREMLDEGINVCLATDVGGSWSPSMLAAAREASISSRVLGAVSRDYEHWQPHYDLSLHPLSRKLEASSREEDETSDPTDRSEVSADEYLHMSTAAGAQALGLDYRVGQFAVGMEFEAQQVSSVSAAENSNDNPESDDPDSDSSLTQDRIQDRDRDWRNLVAKWLFGGNDRNTQHVWVCWKPGN